MKMINTSKCEECIHCTLDDKLMIHCKEKEKIYYYGQAIPCEDFKAKDKTKEN